MVITIKIVKNFYTDNTKVTTSKTVKIQKQTFKLFFELKRKSFTVMKIMIRHNTSNKNIIWRWFYNRFEWKFLLITYL